MKPNIKDTKRRTQMLRVRFSTEEWNRLQGLAEAANMTLSEVIRNHLGKTSIRNRKDEHGRIVVLNRINANLNMIARWCNTHKASAQAVEVVSHLIAIERAVRNIAK